MNVRDILKEYLITHKYDGLFNAHGCCGCTIEDLISCDVGPIDGCEPGYKTTSDDPDFDFYITSVKEVSHE